MTFFTIILPVAIVETLKKMAIKVVVHFGDILWLTPRLLYDRIPIKYRIEQKKNKMEGMKIEVDIDEIFEKYIKQSCWYQ